jgi:hypothetical protein
LSSLLVITTLAGLPLDVIGHTVSRYYGISVQGWGSWLEDLGKGLCLTVLFGAPVLLLLQLDCARLAAPLLDVDLAGVASADSDFLYSQPRCLTPSSTSSSH